MTNKDKFLKDGVSVEEFIDRLVSFAIIKCDHIRHSTIRNFLETPIKPTLTEDERVILKNIDTDYYPTIKRMGRTLYLVDKEDAHKEIEYMFKDHLFQFIKERRRIRDKGAAKMKPRNFEITIFNNLGQYIYKGKKKAGMKEMFWKKF